MILELLFVYIIWYFMTKYAIVALNLAKDRSQISLAVVLYGVASVLLGCCIVIIMMKGGIL